jgi:hypothetical protein
LEASVDIELRETGDGYAFDVPGGIAIEIERLGDESGGLTGEITIAEQTGLGTRLLHSARLNLMSTQSRSTLTKALTAVCETPKWAIILEQICFLAREQYRRGNPLIRIGHLPPSQKPRWLNYPFIEEAGSAILFGDGSAGKSILAAAIGIGVASGQDVFGKTVCPATNVCYLDWEACAESHDERIKALCKPLDLPVPQNIFYRREYAPLAESAPNLRRELVKQKIGLIIIDSLGAACDGAPEKSDVTTRLYNAARSFEIPWFGIHHITKQNGTDGGAMKPFGSVYGHNLARLTWGIEAAQEEGEESKGITLTNHKANNGRREHKRTYRLQFYTEGQEQDCRTVGIEIRQCDVGEFPDLLKKRPITERIIAALRRGHQTYIGISEETGIPVDDLMMPMNRLKKAGTVEKIPGLAPVEFGLVARVGQ